MNILELKEKLIYGFWNVTLLDLLSTDEIVKLMSYHTDIYISTYRSENDLLDDAFSLGYLKDIKIVNCNSIQKLNLDNSILIVEHKRQEIVSNVLSLKDKFPSSTIIFCNKSTLMPLTSKEKIDIILINGNALDTNLHNNGSIHNLMKERLSFYINSQIMEEYSRNNNNFSGLYAYIDDKLYSIKDFSNNEKSKVTQKPLSFTSDTYTLKL